MILKFLTKYPNTKTSSVLHVMNLTNRTISAPITITQIIDTTVLLHVFISLKDRLYYGPKIATHRRTSMQIIMCIPYNLPKISIVHIML